MAQYPSQRQCIQVNGEVQGGVYKSMVRTKAVYHAAGAQGCDLIDGVGHQVHGLHVKRHLPQQRQARQEIDPGAWGSNDINKSWGYINQPWG